MKKSPEMKDYTMGILNVTTPYVDIKAGLGQVVEIEVINYGGTCPLQIEANTQKQGAFLIPFKKYTFKFTCLGEEPVPWNIRIDSEGSAHQVAYTIRSNYVG